MSILQSAVKAFEDLTGFAKPKPEDVGALARRRKATEFRFKDDGLVPNHPSWPLIVYRGAIELPEKFDPASVIEMLFRTNGWGDSWRNGIYDYVHYHSRIHEVLGVARGKARVRFGGIKGRIIAVKAGDVAVLPAGTGHQCVSASDDFLVVGAYPPSGTYDECTKADQRQEALVAIRKVAPPGSDPVYGSDGPVVRSWVAGKPD
jgi:uncharacterized protein YjlB